jgi:hypothetical protein
MIPIWIGDGVYVAGICAAISAGDSSGLVDLVASPRATYVCFSAGSEAINGRTVAFVFVPVFCAATAVTIIAAIIRSKVPPMMTQRLWSNRARFISMARLPFSH